MSQDPWGSPPPPAPQFKYEAVVNCLTLTVLGGIGMFTTQYGTRKAARAIVIVLSGQDRVRTYEDVAVFGRSIVSQLEEVEPGGSILARVVLTQQGTKSIPELVPAINGADIQFARDWYQANYQYFEEIRKQAIAEFDAAVAAETQRLQNPPQGQSQYPPQRSPIMQPQNRPVPPSAPPIGPNYGQPQQAPQAPPASNPAGPYAPPPAPQAPSAPPPPPAAPASPPPQEYPQAPPPPPYQSQAYPEPPF